MPQTLSPQQQYTLQQIAELQRAGRIPAPQPGVPTAPQPSFRASRAPMGPPEDFWTKLKNFTPPPVPPLFTDDLSKRLLAESDKFQGLDRQGPEPVRSGVSAEGMHTPPVERRDLNPIVKRTDLHPFRTPATSSKQKGRAESKGKDENRKALDGEREEGPTRLQKLSEYLKGRRSEMESKRAMRALAEGLGSFRAVTAGDIIHGSPIPPPMVAEDLRADIARAEVETAPENDPASPLSMQAQEAMSNLTGLPKDRFEGWSYSQLLTMKPEDLAASSQIGRPLSAHSAEGLADMQTVLEEVDYIRNSLKDNDISSSVGPIMGRYNQVLHTLGITNKKKAPFFNLVNGLKMSYMRSLIGSQMTRAEMKNVLGALPRPTQNLEAFKTSLNEFEERMKRQLENRREVLSQTGYAVPGDAIEITPDNLVDVLMEVDQEFAESVEPIDTGGSTAGGMRRYEVNGKVLDLTPERAARAQAAGFEVYELP